jgi:hypothetical protein
MTGLGIRGIEPSAFASRELSSVFPYYIYDTDTDCEYPSFVDVKEIMADIK